MNGAAANSGGELMIEVSPHRYVNWLSALQTGKVGKRIPPDARQYERHADVVVKVTEPNCPEPDNDNDTQLDTDGAVFDRKLTPTNIFAGTYAPVRNPYRVHKKWLRDQSGALVRDENGHPVAEPRKYKRKPRVVDLRPHDWMIITGCRMKIAKTWTEGKMKEEHTAQERALMHAIAWHRRVVGEEELLAAVARFNSRHASFVASAANDNEPRQGWELLRQLRRDKREDDIEVVEMYRGLCGLIASQPLRGCDYGYDSSLEKEYTSNKMTTEDIDEAAANNWTSTDIPGGEIKYGRVRQRSKSDLGWTHPPKQYAVADDDTKVKARPFAVKFNENVMIAKIDMRPVLEELRRSLGVGLDAFEDAVLGGKTLTEIGQAKGFTGKQASAAGKALVYASIDGLRDAWNRIKRQRRKDAKKALENVQRARERLEAQKFKSAA